MAETPTLKGVVISWIEMSAGFGLPVLDACAQLGLSQNQFRRCMRLNQIDTWPSVPIAVILAKLAKFEKLKGHRDLYPKEEVTVRRLTSMKNQLEKAGMGLDKDGAQSRSMILNSDSEEGGLESDEGDEAQEWRAEKRRREQLRVTMINETIKSGEPLDIVSAGFKTKIYRPPILPPLHTKEEKAEWKRKHKQTHRYTKGGMIAPAATTAPAPSNEPTQVEEQFQ